MDEAQALWEERRAALKAEHKRIRTTPAGWLSTYTKDATHNKDKSFRPLELVCLYLWFEKEKDWHRWDEACNITDYEFETIKRFALTPSVDWQTELG